MVSSPSEVIKFIRQNRSVVSDTLNKRLNKKQRPTREQLEQQILYHVVILIMAMIWR